MTWDWRKEYERQHGKLPSAPPAEPDVEPAPAEPYEGSPAPGPGCNDCYTRPGIIVDVFHLRGMRVQRVKCPSCGRVRRRQGGAE